MKKSFENGICTIFPEGRIDSGNAPLIEGEMLDAIKEYGDADIVLDACGLEYISSAGLRVLMKLRRSHNGTLKIINVSGLVYDIFETTGFTELFEVKKAYRTIDVKGLEVIGKGFFGTVYRIDPETIVKVYKGKDSIPMIENEKRMAQKAFVNGIPTAISYDIVRVGEDYGSVFELLNARTMHEIALEGSEPLESIIEKYIKLLKEVHSITPSGNDFPSFKDRFLGYLEYLKDCLEAEQYELLKKLFSEMEDEDRFVHGDIQMKNVMVTPDEALLIDMDTIGRGNPVFDLAGLYVTYQEFEEDEPGNSMSFLNMPQEMVDEIWKLIIESYFDFGDESERQSVLNRIKLTAAVRFLYLIVSTDLKNSELGALRIRHTREHITDLLKSVDHIAI